MSKLLLITDEIKKKLDELLLRCRKIKPAVACEIGRDASRGRSLDVLANKFSCNTDKVILKEVSKGYNYAGGELAFCLDGEAHDSVKAMMCLYFYDNDGAWFIREGCSSIAADSLSDVAYDELRRQRKVAFQVDAPEIS